MKRFFARFKNVAFLLVAALAFGQALSYANLTQADSGPLQVSTHVRNYTRGGSYATQVNAKPGELVTQRIFVKNTSTTETLQGARVKVELSDMLEYVPGETKIEDDFNVFDPAPDGITDEGIELPNMVPNETLYVYYRAKVKDGASGALSQTTTFWHGTYSATSSTAKVNVSDDNDEVAPNMGVRTRVVNLKEFAEKEPGTDDWKDSIQAKAGDTIAFYVGIANNKPAGVNSRLDDVVVKVRQNQNADGFRLVGTGSAKNHTAKNDAATIKTGAHKLQLVNGSGRVYFKDSSGTEVSAPLPDTVFTDSGVQVGDVEAGGNATERFVYFQMRLTNDKEEGTIQFEKHIKKNGVWIENGIADPDKVVEFIVHMPGDQTRTVTTNQLGRAELKDMPFGDYFVEEKVPTGWTLQDTTPADGHFTLSESHPVQQFIAQNVKGEQPTPKGKLTIIKFLDANGNGVRDAGEGPQADVEFTITGLNGAVDLTMDTNTEGKIELTELTPGNYTAKETVPAGYQATTPTEQTAEVKANETATLTFGNKVVVTPPPTEKGNLTVIKFIDANGNGVRDNNEGPQAGVVFKVTGPDGYNFTGSTNADGKIELRDLVLGQYTAVETVPADYEATTATTQSGQVKANETTTLTFGNKLKPITPPQGGAPSLQLAKYVGNASRNEVADKTQTTAVAGDKLNWKIWLKNVGNESVKDLKVNDVLPANVTVTGDIVIIRDGQRFRFQDFTRGFVTIGDLAPNQEVTIELATIASRDLACNNELVNVVYAEAANHAKINAQAKAVIECVQVAGKQQPLVRTGSEQAIFSMILSMLAVAGYVYNRQRKTLNNLFGSL